MAQSDPFFEDEAAFRAHAAAEAQFWTTGPHNDQPGLLITIPRLGYEFSNGAYVGRDPGGIFSYNTLADIPINDYANFEVKIKGSGEGTYVTVLFYGVNGRDICGQFVGADPEHLAKASGLVGKIRTGRWTEPGIGSTSAIFRKPRGSSVAQVIGIASHWIAEFKLSGDFTEELIEVKGELRYHDQDLIDRGLCVRWVSDHLIFFENDITSREYTAYFMAHDDKYFTELMPEEHIDLTVRGVKWSYHKHD